MAKAKQPLTLLFFSPYFYPYLSGLTQYPYRLFTHIPPDIKATCLTFRHESNIAPFEALSDRCSIVRMPAAFRLSKGFISPSSLDFFWRYTSTADVVLLNLPSFEGIFLAFFAWLRKKPVVSLLHCEVLLPPSFINSVINSILNAAVWLQLAISKKIIVYTTDYYANKPFYARFQHKMQVIPPPVHSDVPDPCQLKLFTKQRTGKKCIGFCGRIAYEKGVDVLINAVAGRTDIVLFFAGPTGSQVVGEESSFTHIRALLKEKKIPHHFFGSLQGAALSAWYQSLDVLVLPSINKTEAFGMVQAEAMIQGVPVVASNLPGVRVPIRLTGMGELANPNDVYNLRKTIDMVLAHRRHYASPLLQQKACTLFNAQKTYKAVYDTLVRCAYS